MPRLLCHRDHRFARRTITARRPFPSSCKHSQARPNSPALRHSRPWLPSHPSDYHNHSHHPRPGHPIPTNPAAPKAIPTRAIPSANATMHAPPTPSTRHYIQWGVGRPPGGGGASHGRHGKSRRVRFPSLKLSRPHSQRKSMLSSVFHGGFMKVRGTHCAVCGGLLPDDGRWWRKFCSRYCSNVSTGAARRERDPTYAARKAREWRANPPPRTDEQIAADRRRRATNERRRRARKLAGAERVVFGTTHVEHQDEILNESERLQPSPPPHAQPSTLYRGHGIDSRSFTDLRDGPVSGR